MSSALTIVASVKARVRIQRTVRRRELVREARDSERIGERRPPPPARRPSATQPILCHLKQNNKGEIRLALTHVLYMSVKVLNSI